MGNIECFGDRDDEYIDEEGDTEMVMLLNGEEVPVSEYNPFEFIKTNVLGAQNIIESVIQNNVNIFSCSGKSEMNFYEANFKQSLALIFGSENDGVSKYLEELSDPVAITASKSLPLRSSTHSYLPEKSGFILTNFSNKKGIIMVSFEESLTTALLPLISTESKS